MSVAFSPDARIVASACRSGATFLWDARSRTLIRQLQAPNTGTCSIAFSPDGNLLVTVETFPGCPNAEGQWAFHLWEVATGRHLYQSPTQRGWGGSIAFSPDGRCLAWRGSYLDKTIHLWNCQTRTEAGLLIGQTGVILAIAFSPDGRTLLSADENGRVHLWEIRSGNKRAEFAGHTNRATCLALSPNGHFAVSGSEDTTLLVWNTGLPVPDKTLDQSSMDPSQLNACWTELASLDAAQAYQAMQRMALVPDDTVSLMRRHLKRAQAIDAIHLHQLLANLDSDEFSTREMATRQLETLGDLAEPALAEALAKGPPPEARRRITRLYDRLSLAHQSTARLQLFRSVELMEALGTPQAMEVLADIAKGAPQALLTQEAKASLTRLTRPKEQ
jgi:hypothetical protein